MLVDTAAQVSVLWRNAISVKQIGKKKFELYGLGQSKVENYGHTNVDIKIEDEHFSIEAQITDVFHKLYDGLMGLDFLEKHGGAIDTQARTLRLNGVFYPLTSVAEEEARGVFACRGVASPKYTHQHTWVGLRLSVPESVPPRATRIIQVNIPFRIAYNSAYVVQPQSENRPHDDTSYMKGLLMRLMMMKQKIFAMKI